MSEAIGERLRGLRHGKGMTQSDLAHILGVTKSAVQKYESGQVGLTADKIKILCNTFSVYPRVFVYDSDEEFVGGVFDGIPDVDRNIDRSFFEASIAMHALESYMESDIVRIVRMAQTLNRDGRMRLLSCGEVLNMVPEFRKEP